MDRLNHACFVANTSTCSIPSLEIEKQTPAKTQDGETQSVVPNVRKENSFMGVVLSVDIEDPPPQTTSSTRTIQTEEGSEIDSNETLAKPQVGLVIYKGEIKTWSLWRGAITECYGMILFLFFSVGTVASTSQYSEENDFEGLDSARHWMIASVFGFMIAILVYVLAPVSGANLNPAVSVSLICTKKISPLRGFIYITAQCIGACIGCALVKAVDPHGYHSVGGAINSVSEGYSNQNAFIAEFIGTSLLLLAVASVVDANNDQYDRVNMKQSHGVSSIGLAVTMAHCVLIPITNCSINPARSFGASFIYGEYPEHWIFWTAPILGGLFASLFYEVVIMDREF